MAHTLSVTGEQREKDLHICEGSDFQTCRPAAQTCYLSDMQMSKSTWAIKSETQEWGLALGFKHPSR